MDQKRYADAGTIFTELMKEDPTFIPAYEQMGICSVRLKQYDVALNFFKTLCGANPEKKTKYKQLIGAIYSEKEEYHNAIETLAPITHQITEGRYHFCLAVAYMYTGNKQKAQEEFKKAYELEPDKPIFFIKYIMNASPISSEEDPLLQKLHSIKSKIEKDDEFGAEVYNALFLTYEQLGLYEKAFKYAEKAASHQRATIDYDITKDVKPASHKNIFTPNYFENIDLKSINNSHKPIFICAMPRSGTTLLEQILSAHAKIAGIGEDTFLEDALREHGTLNNLAHSLGRTEQTASAIFKLTQKTENKRDSGKIADEYIKYIDNKHLNSERVVNKSISNYMHAGFIFSTMPNARLIQIKRDAVDSCLSTFTILFKDKTQEYSYDFKELAHRYIKHMELMDHWKSLFPEKIYTLHYEDLVEDTEKYAREVIDFLGLEWDPNCLEFYKQKSIVKTASVEQVRKPIYKSSVARWKRYGPAVKPLIEALGDYASEEAREYLKSEE